MTALSVFTRLYGENALMTPARALLISAVGFLLVFAVLSLISLFVRLMGKVFDAAGKRVKTTKLSVPEPEPVLSPAETQGEGRLTLTDVEEEEAAVIMAITADKLGLPLNRLQFNSIKKLPDGE